MSTNKTNTGKGIVMTEISAKEFGKLQSDVAYLAKASDRHTELLEKMDGKLDGMVTQKQLNDRIEPIETDVKNQCTRIEALEQRNQISDASVWKKIALAFEGNFIKFVGISLFVFALSVAYIYLQEQLEEHRAASESTVITKPQQ